MSFNNSTNSWGGPSNYNGQTSTVNVVSNFPTAPLTSLSIPQSVAHSGIYTIPTYLTLSSLTADKSDLVMLRGGYAGDNPTNQKLKTKLACDQQKASSQYYCALSTHLQAPRMS